MRYRVLASVLLAGFLVSAGCGKKSSAPVVDGGSSPAPQQTGRPLDKLIAELKSNSVPRRDSAVKELAQFDADVAIPPVLAALTDKGFTEGATIPGEPNSTREAAVIVLLKMGAAGDKAIADAGLAILTAGLADSAPGVREHSAIAIGLLGPKGKAAADALAKLYADENEALRRAAYDSLQKIDGLTPQPLVAVLISKSDAKIRFDAARFLNSIRPLPKALVPTLAGLLRNPVEKEADEEALIRLEVAEALASFGKDAEPAIPALMGVVSNTTVEDFIKFSKPNSTDDSPAMMALRKIGKPAVPALEAALESEKAIVRWQAATVLAGIGPDAKESLPKLQAAFAKELEQAVVDVSVVAAVALAEVQLGGDSKEPVAKLAEILKSPVILMPENNRSRLYLVRTLGRFGRKGEAAVSALIPLLDDPQPIISEQAALTLRAIGPGAKAAVPALAKKLADENLDVCRSAALTLKSLGPIAVEATPELTKLLAHTDDVVRREAIEALMAVGPAAKAAVPELAKLVKAGDERERVLALQALALFGPEAKAAVPDVLPLLGGKEEDTRWAAINALAQFGVASAEVVAGLGERLRKEGKMTGRIAAARALAMLGPSAKAAAPDLKKFGESTDPVAKVWSAAALYKLGVDADANLQFVVAALKNKQSAREPKAARLAAISSADLLGASAKAVLPELIEALNEKTPVGAGDATPVRQRAVAALGRMGPDAKSAVKPLTLLLKDSDPDLKRAVLGALRQIGPGAEFAAARLREIVRTEPDYAEAAQEALDRIEKK